VRRTNDVLLEVEALAMHEDGVHCWSQSDQKLNFTSKWLILSIVMFLQLYCSELPAKSIGQILKVSPKTVADWCNFIREVCSQELLRCPMKIGNFRPVVTAIFNRLLMFLSLRGSTTEIDETNLKKKQIQCWTQTSRQLDVRGMGCRETKKWLGVLVAYRSKQTVSAIIRNHIV
jgi:hypothetical protein